MTTPQSITSEIQKLNPSAVVELFELDASTFGGDTYYFHAGTNDVKQNIVWQGQTYTAYPVEITGFTFVTGEQIPRPRMRVANVTGIITALVLAYDDLIGAKVTRKRTLAKYLDAVNFDGGVNADADSTAEFPDDIYYIDQKVNENMNIVEFELAASFDVAGIKLPKRQIIQNVCPWVYRSSECSYTGTDYFDKDDNVVATSGQDVCGKRLSSCKARFGEYNELPFGGFPAAGLIK